LLRYKQFHHQSFCVTGGNSLQTMVSNSKPAKQGAEISHHIGGGVQNS
jgi:hypothetical protein